MEVNKVVPCFKMEFLLFAATMVLLSLLPPAKKPIPSYPSPMVLELEKELSRYAALMSSDSVCKL